MHQDSTTTRLKGLRIAVAIASAIALVLPLLSVLAASAQASTVRTQPDTYRLSEDHVLVVANPGVLKNDRGDGPLRARRVNGPYHGTLLQSDGGGIKYHPNANYHGKDSYTYRACEARRPLDCHKDIVHFYIKSVNDAPTAPDMTLQATEDKTLTFAAPGVLAGARDVDGDKLTAQMVTAPTHGRAVVNADGSGTYRGSPNYNGRDTITVKVTDPHGANTYRRVYFNVAPVNDAPTAVNDRYYQRENEFREIEEPGLLKNDRDPDHDRLYVAHCTDSRHAAITCYSNGRVGVRPNRNFYGLLAFNYIVTDKHGGSDHATAYVHVMRTR